MANRHNLEAISKADCDKLIHKDSTYKGSWKKRGGVGAFMMLARKWDRIENMALEKGYDIFTLLQKESQGFSTAPNDLEVADGTLLAEIRDLRQYLLLVEDWLMDQSSNPYVPNQAKITDLL